MAITRSLLSLDEYLRASYHPDADFIDGQIEERHLGEYEHARLQYILASLFARKERDRPDRTAHPGGAGARPHL